MSGKISVYSFYQIGVGDRNGWADRKKDSVRLSQMDGSRAGNIRSDRSGAINHCCRFLEPCRSKHGLVTAAIVGHSTPMTFSLTAGWYFWFCPLVNVCLQGLTKHLVEALRNT